MDDILDLNNDPHVIEADDGPGLATHEVEYEYRNENDPMADTPIRIDHYDFDGDGNVDLTTVDSDNDGRPETIYRDRDDNGYADEIQFDRDEDGRFEEVLRDTDGNHTYDEWSYDRNEDGRVDQVIHDVNGDGRPDVAIRTSTTLDIHEPVRHTP